MSDLSSAVQISGGIFAVMMATQYGTRSYGRRNIVLPIALAGVFGMAYLKTAPTDHNSMMVYGVALGLGLVFALIAAATTRMFTDRETGSIMTRCGLGFVAVWAVAVAARIGFVWATTDITAFRQWFGEHLMSLQLSPAVIAPFFVIWALSMVLGRAAILAGRAAALHGTRTSVAALA
ncbi:hypothetical protein [Williamsia sp. CHRR-6]|uniref:hypothetical protein n=1 Tax=Williamsia sp. CHRR-6 TaxID=2835871 RepID=UPI001BDB4978|nr:hypothetical protein [Williamsia sp. CHRR-6]MBT0567683.1 hypothetical protein [Williamsia sp. CHRR-6]